MVNKPELADITAAVMALPSSSRYVMTRLVLAGWTFHAEAYQDPAANNYWVGKDPNEGSDLYRYELVRLIEACNTRQREHEEAECQATSQSA